ncbi:helix-turn-helix transcriptional regulator [Mycoplasmatota bacterium WC44]
MDNYKIEHTLGMKLKKYRVINGYSQEEIAKKLNIAKATYNRYENDNRTPDSDMLNEIADILNINYLTFMIDEIFNWEQTLEHTLDLTFGNVASIFKSKYDTLSNEEREEFIEIMRDEYKILEEKKKIGREVLKPSSFEELSKIHMISDLVK